MTAEQLARILNRRASDVEREFRQTLRGLGMAAVRFTREKLTEEVYAIPEDVSPRTGRKQWQRTGRLRKGEAWEQRGLDSVAIINRTPYAAPRHEAGKPGHRRINPLRESHWRDDLVTTFRPLLSDLYHQTIQSILARRAP